MNLRTILGALCALGAVAALAGCGSGGGGGSTSGGGTTPLVKGVGLYATDAFNDDYSQVWITLYKIELSTDGTTFTTVYDQPAGVSIDAASLASKATLLATVNIPAGDYTTVRVTTGDHITLVPVGGGASVSAPVDPTKATVSGGQAVVTVSIPKHIASAASNNIVIDFNLAAFKLVGGKVQCSIGDGDTATFPTKAHEAEVRGTISNLVAGTGFTLTLDNGNTVNVTLTSATIILSPVVSATATTAPTLANGQKVVVIGSVDTTTHVIAADRIRIVPAQDGGDGSGSTGGGSGTPPPPPSDFGHGDDGTPGSPPPPPGGTTTVHTAAVIGKVTAVDTTALTITVKVTDAEGFQPQATTATIQTSSKTRFVKEKTVITLSDVTVGSNVIAVGTVDATTGQFNAAEVHLLLK
jgi:hypothetical protein